MNTSPDIRKRLLSYADDLDLTERPTPGEYDVTADIRELCNQLEYARRTIRDIGVFCSGEDTTLGAIKRLTHIQNTAQQFCAKTDDFGEKS